MNLLALETSGTTGSIALFQNEAQLAELDLDPQQRSARSLAPAIQQILSTTGVSAADVNLIAVTVGPGSFTGLRVGVVTAKVFAYAVGCEVIGVNSLEAIASSVGKKHANRPILTVMDAQRGDLFVARWRWIEVPGATANTSLECLLPTQIMKLDELLPKIQPDDYIIGPALEKFAARFSPAQCAPPESWKPQATDVGHVGLKHFKQCGADNLFDLVPNYIRRAAAEEQWEARQK